MDSFRKVDYRVYRESDFDWLWTLMELSFPESELFPKPELAKHLRQKYCQPILALSPDLPKGLDREDLLDHSSEAGARLALILGWDFPEFYFVEYLASDPACRNRGLARLLFKDLEQTLDKSLVFECELPQSSSWARRRYNYYRKLGFWPYSIAYAMPSLNGGEPIPMHLMGGETRLSDQALGPAIDLINAQVYGDYAAQNQA